jgi:hypothetical protein
MLREWLNCRVALLREKGRAMLMVARSFKIESPLRNDMVIAVSCITYSGACIIHTRYHTHLTLSFPCERLRASQPPLHASYAIP